MKKDIHPEYRDVIFRDISNDYAFKTRSTIKTKETIKWVDGKEYPLVKTAISAASHPFYTGRQTFVDAAGRIEKFRQRYKLAEGEGTKDALQRAQETAKEKAAKAKKDEDES